jgi:hypothetical protein
MKPEWRVEVKLHTFFTSELDEAEWSVSCFGCFMPRERLPWQPLDRRNLYSRRR